MIIEPTPIVEKTRRYIACPTCKFDEGFCVDHLLDRTTSFGPWYCDRCGYAICGRVDGGVVTLEEVPALAGRRRTPTIVVLRVRDTDIKLILERFTLNLKTPEERHESDRYFFEEHTCPTNVTRDIRMIIDGDDQDPHGVFEFIGEIDATPDMMRELHDHEIPLPVRGLMSIRGHRTSEEK